MRVHTCKFVVCVHVYYLSLSARRHLYVHIYMYICVCVCMYVCMCMYMYVCMHVCMHACLYVCMYVYIYIYIYTYIHIIRSLHMTPKWAYLSYGNRRLLLCRQRRSRPRRQRARTDVARVSCGSRRQRRRSRCGDGSGQS